MALIILGHPDLNTSVANKTIVEEVSKSNVKDLEIRNLTALYPNFDIDAQQEQEALLKHNVIIFQYPFYWYNMTPILKKWFDVVFEYQFAFGSQGDKLKNKYFLPSITVGSHESKYRSLKMHNFRILEFCKNLEQTALLAQMNYIDPLFCFETSIVDGYSVESRTEVARIHSIRLLDKIGELEAEFASI